MSENEPVGSWRKWKREDKAESCDINDRRLKWWSNIWKEDVEEGVTITEKVGKKGRAKRPYDPWGYCPTRR